MQCNVIIKKAMVCTHKSYKLNILIKIDRNVIAYAIVSLSTFTVNVITQEKAWILKSAWVLMSTDVIAMSMHVKNNQLKVIKVDE